MSATTFVVRERVTHFDNLLLRGEVTAVISGPWVKVAWDNGTSTSEHIDDILSLRKN